MDKSENIILTLSQVTFRSRELNIYSFDPSPTPDPNEIKFKKQHEQLTHYNKLCVFNIIKKQILNKYLDVVSHVETW